MPVTSFLFVFIRQRVEIACICLIPLLYCQCTGDDEKGSGAEGVPLDAKSRNELGLFAVPFFTLYSYGKN